MPQDHRNRSRNQDWGVDLDVTGSATTVHQAMLAVLMDVREQLQYLNQTLGCPNFQAIPRLLRAIEQSTRKKPKLRAVKKRRAA